VNTSFHLAALNTAYFRITLMLAFKAVGINRGRASD
jgi:hypothetical protein